MDKLNKILNEIIDGSKKGDRFIKKFNLSLYDISLLFKIAKGERIFMNFNLLPVLKYLKINYEIDSNNINLLIKEQY